MDIGTARLILSSKRPGSSSESYQLDFRLRRQRVFVQVLHEIFSRRNDRSGRVHEWAECLMCLAEGDGDPLEGLEDFPIFLLRLAAFQQYRERKEAVPERRKHKIGVGEEENSHARTLLTFLSMPSMVKMMNETIEGSAFSPSETDWMALNLLFKHTLIERRLYAHVLLLIAGSQGLAGLLEMTPEAWKPNMGYVIRQKVENIVFIMFRILSEEPEKHDLMLTLCGKSLFNVSLRLEAGLESARDANAEEAEGLDAGFFSSSDEEEGEQDDSMVAHTPEVDDDGAFSPGEGGRKMQDMILKCIQAEENLPAYRTSWCDLCLTAVTILHERLIEGKREEETKNRGETQHQQFKRGAAANVSVGPPLTHQGFSDAISALNSPAWQRQLLSLDTLMDILIRGKESSSGPAKSSSGRSVPKGKAGEGTGTGTAGSSKRGSTVGSGKQPTQKRGSVSSKGPSQALKPVEELSRSGYLRHLCWGLVSSRGRVRARASALLGTVLEVSSQDQGAMGANLWAAFVEQGLVPLLEVVRLGYPVSQVPSRTSGLAADEAVHLFPERVIRGLVDSTLNTLADRLSSSDALRVRLASALLHSGNPALRMNIFVALLFLARKSDECGLCIWRMSTPSQTEGASRKSSSSAKAKQGNTSLSATAAAVDDVGDGDGEVFLGMLKGMLRDTTELKTILAVVAHTLRSALEVKKADSSLSAKVVAAKAASKAKQMDRGGKRTGPTVVVDDEGSRIKMACPDPSTVLRHSPDLAELLQQMAEQEAEQEADVFAAADEASLPTLTGSYTLWQEMFTHMTSDQMQDSSIAQMPLDQVVDAFHIARKYRMSLLLEKYAKALGKCLTTDTVVTVWSCALGKEMRDGVLVNPLPLSSSDAAATGGSGGNLLPPPLQAGTPGSHPPTSPTAPSSTDMFAAAFNAPWTLGRGTPAHLGLLSTCMNWIEKAGASAFSQKRPLLAAELLELTHQTLGLIIAG